MLVTILLTLICPATAIIYNGKLRSGIIVAFVLMLIELLVYALLGISFFILLLGILFLAAILFFFMVVNIRSTVRVNEHPIPFVKKGWLWIIGVFIGINLLCWMGNIVIEQYTIKAYKVPTGSMEPALLPGDYLMAGSGVKTSDILRGDIIIFQYPGDRSQKYLKRVVALGGDKVRIEDKQLYINDEKTPLPFGATLADSHCYPHSYQGNWVKGEDGTNIWLTTGSRDNMPETIIPLDQFFVLGDNRDNSVDSRNFGSVDIDMVVGKAKFIHFSWDSKANSIRWARIGKRLQEG